MPRTCLPKPCVQALTPFRLAALIGRNPSEGEWDEYFARYADFCRKEVVPFKAVGPEGLAEGHGDVRPEAAFWLPLLAGFATDRRGPPGTAPTGGGNGPTGGGGVPIFVGGGGGGGGGGTPGAGGVLPDGGSGVTAVPLPAPIWLLIAGLLGLRTVRARRKVTSA